MERSLAHFLFGVAGVEGPGKTVARRDCQPSVAFGSTRRVDLYRGGQGRSHRSETNSVSDDVYDCRVRRPLKELLK